MPQRLGGQLNHDSGCGPRSIEHFADLLIARCCLAVLLLMYSTSLSARLGSLHGAKASLLALAELSDSCPSTRHRTKQPLKSPIAASSWFIVNRAHPTLSSELRTTFSLIIMSMVVDSEGLLEHWQRRLCRTHVRHVHIRTFAPACSLRGPVPSWVKRFHPEV